MNPFFKRCMPAGGVAVVVLLLLAAFELYRQDKESSREASAVRGEVMEVLNFEAQPSQWTYRPLANAEVMAAWIGYKPHSRFNVTQGRECIRKAFTRTAADGSFFFSAWTAEAGIAIEYGMSAAFVPGYEEVNALDRNGDRFSPGEGLHVFRRLTGADGAEDRERKFRYPYYCGESNQ
jgi:hypothetical protein